MDEERVAIVCRPTAGFASRIPGSTRDVCSICEAEVWVAPSSRAVAADPIILCSDCAPGVIATEADPQVQPITAAQRAELRALGWEP